MTRVSQLPTFRMYRAANRTFVSEYLKLMFSSNQIYNCFALQLVYRPLSPIRTSRQKKSIKVCRKFKVYSHVGPISIVLFMD